jgi:hypothetical protein
MAFLGCTSRTVGWKKDIQKVSLTKDQMQETFDQAQYHWNRRHIKDHLEMFIVNFEKLSRSIGNKTLNGFDLYKVSERLSRAYYILADSHYNKLSMKKKYWEVGAGWAERALSFNKKFKRVVEEENEFIPGLRFLEKKQVGAIYWYLANVGKWAKNSGVATTLRYKNLIQHMNYRILKLDPDFYYGAVYRYWGAFYAVAPNYAGGDLEKSFRNFRKSLELAPDYLGTKVLMAALYGVKSGKRSFFKKTLQDVLRAPINKTSEIYPENYLEKKKARRLLESIETLF